MLLSFRCRVQTLGERRRFILTQLPLPDTVVDLWRLVAGNDVNMVVSIGCETDDVEVSRRHRNKVKQERLTCSCTIQYSNFYLSSKLKFTGL